MLSVVHAASYGHGAITNPLSAILSSDGCLVESSIQVVHGPHLLISAVRKTMKAMMLCFVISHSGVNRSACSPD